MSLSLKLLLIVGPGLMSLFYAATSPIIHVYFIKLIGPDILAIANMITCGLAAITSGSFSTNKIRNICRKNFHSIILIDIICFALISFESLSIPEIRFIGFAVLNAVSTTLWAAIMKDAINHVISGDALTNFENQLKSSTLFMSFAGGIFAVFNTNIDINYCIIAQCIANMIMGCTDWFAYKEMKADKQTKI